MEEIYNEYSKTIYNYLMTLTQNSDVAEELLQETFYSAIKNINKFKKQCSIKTWLYKIAKNKYIDYCNKLKKRNETNIDNCDELSLSNNLCEKDEKDILNKDELLNIFSRVHKLDEISKEIIYLRISTDFSFKDIGFIFGKSEQWARTIFYRAKIKLKEDFKNE